MSQMPPRLHSYRRELEQAIAADRRRTRRRRLGGVAAVLAVVVVAVNLLPSGGERRLPATVEPASALQRAAQALDPQRGELLHIHIVGRQFEDGRPDLHWEDESWTRVGEDANRTVQTPPEGQGPVVETAYADGVDSIWDERSGRVLEAAAERTEAANTVDGKFRAEALAMLRSPRAKVTPERLDGRKVLRVDSPGSATFVVDAETYVPVELRTRGTGGGTVLRFVTYESLPLDARTEPLLSIAAQHPGAAVVRDPDAYQAMQERLFAHG